AINAIAMKMPSKDSMRFFIGSKSSDRVPHVVKLPQHKSGESLKTVNSRQTGESPVPLPEMLSGFLRLTQQNSFRRDAHQRSRLSGPANPRRKTNPSSNQLA